MAKKKKTYKQLKKEADLKLKKFHLELEELLDKFNYNMDVQMKITKKGIIPQLIVDTPENIARKAAGQPTDLQLAQMTELRAKQNKKDVKNEKVEDGKSVGRPKKKSKKN